MILIVSAHDDPHVDYVRPKLEASGATVACFDPKEYPSQAELALELDGGGGFIRKLLRLREGTFDVSDVTAVWYRRPNSVDASPEVADEGLRVWVRDAAYAGLTGVFELLDCLWVPGKPRVIAAAQNKILQLQVAALLGFRVPTTCITNSPDAFLDFYSRCEGQLVAKQLGSALPTRGGEPMPIFTRVVSRRTALHAQAVRLAPTIFQAYVPKKIELRITLVGDRIFPAAIDSQASRCTKHDWRHYDHDRAAYTPHCLPPDVEEKCFLLVRHFGLSFGAIDMVLTPDGEYVFLEINPNGQWGWVGEQTGMPIANAMADLLLGEVRNERGTQHAISL